MLIILYKVNGNSFIIHHYYGLQFRFIDALHTLCNLIFELKFKQTMNALCDRVSTNLYMRFKNVYHFLLVHTPCVG